MLACLMEIKQMLQIEHSINMMSYNVVFCSNLEN